jgi:hypothetical protein
MSGSAARSRPLAARDAIRFANPSRSSAGPPGVVRDSEAGSNEGCGGID